MDKILIIDDSILQCKMLESILCQKYLVETLNDSNLAMQKTESYQPSLVLLDVVMPAKDGFQILRELKANSSTTNIPVILITSLSDIGNEEKGLNLGAVDYITKPFNEAIVKARIHTHIQLYGYRKAAEHLAMFDALTGLPNRHAYNYRSKKEWECGMQNRFPISIALMDIDFFKQYNDQYGHPKGDELLKRLGALLSNHLKSSSDFVARYGGEEFIFLLPNMDSKEGFLFCESVRKRIEDLNLPNCSPSGRQRRLTVSMGGVTVIPDATLRFEDYVQLADDMLYKAKKSGKNMVIWST